MKFTLNWFLLFTIYIHFPIFIYGVVHESGLSDQLLEVSIDSSTCTSTTNNGQTQFSCAPAEFIISTNVSKIPPLLVQWYYQSTVVTSNGTGCSKVQIDCISSCSTTSFTKNFASRSFIVPPCACTTTNTDNFYTQNISLRILAPYSNAFPYPNDCGSNPLGSSKIIYSETDTLPLINNDNNNDDVIDPVERIYGAPLAAVVVVGILSAVIIFGGVRAIIYYQQKQQDLKDPKKIEPLPNNTNSDLSKELQDVIDEEIDDHNNSIKNNNNNNHDKKINPPVPLKSALKGSSKKNMSSSPSSSSSVPSTTLPNTINTDTTIIPIKTDNASGVGI